MSRMEASYFEGLARHYGAAGASVAEQAANPNQAVSLEMPRGTTPYVRTESLILPDSAPTIMFIPGFGEGIVNKASFAAELNLQGSNVILPGQNRKGMAHDRFGRKDPLAAQAYNYLAVMKHAQRDGETIHFAAHSLGAPVMAKMVELEPELFGDSHLFMLAPAASIHDETFPKLAKDWLGMIKSESDKDRPMEFPDPKAVTAIASVKQLLRNPLRSVREVRALLKEKIDYPELVKKVGSVSVINYAEDAMFPGSRLAPTMEKATRAGVRWVSPYNLKGMSSGNINTGGQGSTHDYEQFSPNPVAGLIMYMLNREL